MGINRGKQFEKQIEAALLNVPATTVDRQHDQTTGYLGSSNVCDYIAYHYPHQYYFECKSCYGNTLNWSAITKTQWDGLLAKSDCPGVVAGYFIWFIDHDVTIFVDAEWMRFLKDLGDKSFHVIKSLEKLQGHFYIVPGEKRRVLFDYDLTDFLGE